MNESKPVVFIDTVCPKPYDPDTLKTEGMGGTEATVIRIAEEMGKSVPVWVMQHGRNQADTKHGAVYKGLKTYLLDKKFQAQAFIVLRAPEVALNMKAKHPNTPVFLWMHDLIQQKIQPLIQPMADAGIRLILVSGFHMTNFVQIAKQDTKARNWPRLSMIYNPIDDALEPDATAVDRNKLVFFSSPHKGLHTTLEAFKSARRQNKHFQLYLANPGYIELDPVDQEGVVNLGVLPHHEVIKHVRNSLCVFYPNHVFPETFGLVLAEANAVGTPVLTHYHGAAGEVLRGREQLIDARNLQTVVDRLMKWYEGDRPLVAANENFRLSHVIKQWFKVLEAK